MAEITTIARPYAEALAGLARDADSWKAWSDMLALAGAVVADARVADLIGNPAVPSGHVVELIRNVCGERLNADGLNFLHVLGENKRFPALPEIARLFDEMKAAQEGTLEARVTTAFQLTDDQMAALKAKLESRFERKINIAQEVDTALIGGVVIQVGDEVLDASVRGKLGDLAATLKA